MYMYVHAIYIHVRAISLIPPPSQTASWLRHVTSVLLCRQALRLSAAGVTAYKGTEITCIAPSYTLQLLH
jgi:hypothetical protein